MKQTHKTIDYEWLIRPTDEPFVFNLNLQGFENLEGLKNTNPTLNELYETNPQHD